MLVYIDFKGLKLKLFAQNGQESICFQVLIVKLYGTKVIYCFFVLMFDRQVTCQVISTLRISVDIKTSSLFIVHEAIINCHSSEKLSFTSPSQILLSSKVDYPVVHKTVAKNYLITTNFFNFIISHRCNLLH